MELYEIVGCHRHATQAEIKKAYRKKANLLHPDKGGDPEKFKELVLAYNILYDPAKRARYDRGESANNIGKTEQTEDQKILALVLGLFIQVATAVDPKTSDLMQLLRDHINMNITNIEAKLSGERKNIAKFQYVATRLRSKSSDNVFLVACEAHIKGIEQMVLRIEDEKSLGMKAIAFLDAYSYELDPEVMRAMRTGWNGIGKMNDPWVEAFDEKEHDPMRDACLDCDQFHNPKKSKCGKLDKKWDCNHCSSYHSPEVKCLPEDENNFCTQCGKRPASCVC